MCLFLQLDEFLVLLHPSHNRKQKELRVLVKIDAHLRPMCVFFVRLTAGKYETFATLIAFFLEPWKGLGSSVPQGPCHIRKTTVILIDYGGGKNPTVVKHYSRVSETPWFPGHNSQEISTE